MFPPSSRRSVLAGQLFVLRAVDHRHGGVLGGQRLIRGGRLVPATAKVPAAVPVEKTGEAHQRWEEKGAKAGNETDASKAQCFAQRNQEGIRDE